MNKKELNPLEYEISLIQNLMRQIIEKPGKRTSFNDRLHLLETMSKASTRLASLIKTSYALNHNNEDLQSILNIALDEVLQEIRTENHQTR